MSYLWELEKANQLSNGGGYVPPNKMVIPADMPIINLTQHQLQDIQEANATWVEVSDDNRKTIVSLLNFNPESQLINWALIKGKAEMLAFYADISGAKCALIGGAPWLMSHLERELLKKGITPVYALSTRKSIETANPETGEVVKTSVFQHLGWCMVEG